MYKMQKWMVIISLLLMMIYIIRSCSVPTFDNALIIAYKGEDTTGTDFEVTGCLGSEIQGLSDYTKIECKYQNVQELHKNAVTNLPKLVTLIFNNNGIERISPNTFNNLPEINTLDLSNNRIEQIPTDLFNNLITLSTLKFDNNKIVTINHAALRGLVNLKVLSLKQNKLSTWEKSWFKNNFVLETINLEDNRITYIQEEAFKDFKNIKNIILGNNEIVDIHQRAFVPIESLSKLDLSKNKLKKLHPDLFQSFNVRALATPPPNTNNRFSLFNIELDLRATFAGIKSLYIHKNNLTYLPTKIMNDLSIGSVVMFFNFHSNPWQCKCLEKIQKWIDRRRILVNVFDAGCVNKDNPICVVPEKNGDNCLEVPDESIYRIYQSQFQKVTTADPYGFFQLCT